MVPIKARDFSPVTDGYLACWNAASITFVVFSFTAGGMRISAGGRRCCAHSVNCVCADVAKANVLTIVTFKI